MTCRIWTCCSWALALVVCLVGGGMAMGQTPAPAGDKPAEVLPNLPNTAVSIPWPEFRAMIEKARGGEVEKSPIDFVLAGSTCAVAVGEKSAMVTAQAEVAILNDRWVLVPLGPAAGVLKVTADGEVAPVITQGPTLMALFNGKAKAKIKLQITSERPVLADTNGTRVEIPLLPGSIVSFSAAIPQANLDVDAPAATALKIAEAAGQTTVNATYRGGDTATLIYRQKQARGLPADARIYGESETLISLEKGLLHFRTSLTARIERAPTRELRIAIDPQSVVLAVTGKEVSKWTEESKPAAKTLVVTFASALEGERKLELVYERDIPEAGGDLAVEPAYVEAARTNHGVVGVRTLGAFEVRPGKSNAERISVSELPASLRGDDGATQIAYKIAEPPAGITLSLTKAKKLAAKVTANTLTRVAVDRGAVRYHAETQYDILHAGVETFRIGLPDGVEVTHTEGPSVRDTQVVTDGKQRTLVVGLKDVAKGRYVLAIDYEKSFTEKELSPVVALLTHPDVSEDRGTVGIEVRGAYELTPTPQGADRIDVKELAQELWTNARSPLLFGYRYENPAATITMALTKHEDLDVLVAMSDVCEATTTITSDGKAVTKMMFIVRNNLKQFMTLRLPEGAQLWSAFVDDRPVTPSKSAKGDVLIPLKKSDPVEDDDEKSYKAQRARQPRMIKQVEDTAADADLKPYDVEIVFVTPAVKLEEKGQVKVGLPQCDIPTGHMAWAVFLPSQYKVVDSTGNLAEVSAFTLPFRHFGESAYLKAKKLASAEKAMQALAEAQDAAKQVDMIAAKATAKGVLPVRVEIPITGEIYRFEKFLTVDEAPNVTLIYRRRTP